MASSRRSRCAACKDLRRQCTDTCTYAAYFPNGKDKEGQFALVKRVFDLVRIQTLLSGTTGNVPVPKTRMYDFVAALVQEAEAHTSDPINGGIPNLVELLIKLKGAREELNVTPHLCHRMMPQSKVACRTVTRQMNPSLLLLPVPAMVAHPRRPGWSSC
ncbi:unnamed protein product [Urochloa humidicola]